MSLDSVSLGGGADAHSQPTIQPGAGSTPPDLSRFAGREAPKLDLGDLLAVDSADDGQVAVPGAIVSDVPAAAAPRDTAWTASELPPGVVASDRKPDEAVPIKSLPAPEQVEVPIAGSVRVTEAGGAHNVVQPSGAVMVTEVIGGSQVRQEAVREGIVSAATGAVTDIDDPAMPVARVAEAAYGQQMVTDPTSIHYRQPVVNTSGFSRREVAPPVTAVTEVNGPNYRCTCLFPSVLNGMGGRFCLVCRGSLE